MVIADLFLFTEEHLPEPHAICGGAIQLPTLKVGSQQSCVVAIRLPLLRPARRFRFGEPLRGVYPLR
jgi:hypothetical protein